MYSSGVSTHARRKAQTSQEDLIPVNPELVPISQPNTNPTLVNRVGTLDVKKLGEDAARKEKGLSFFCDEKFSPGYQYKKT